jgi:DNA polymerase I-like protein with 3'-5' exonuclease and polymerase domains
MTKRSSTGRQVRLPPLQGIPLRTPEARALRKAFEETYLELKQFERVDYSSLELRIAAATGFRPTTKRRK